MKRLPGWRTKLVAEIEASRRSFFRWGKHDCALFVADCIEAMTGRDLAEDLRGTYSSPEGAIAALHAAGFDDLVDLAAFHLPEIHPSRTRTGDVIALRAGPSPARSRERGFGGAQEQQLTGWALGIASGEGAFVLRPDGIGTIPLRMAEKAFRVG